MSAACNLCVTSFLFALMVSLATTLLLILLEWQLQIAGSSKFLKPRNVLLTLACACDLCITVVNASCGSPFTQSCILTISDFLYPASS